MEKTIIIDGKAVRLKATASFAIRYKQQFGVDLLTKLIPMITVFENVDGEIEMGDAIKLLVDNGNLLELNDLYNLIWVLAKTADPSIPEPIEWLDEFSVFPLADILQEAIDLVLPTLISTKESKKKTMTAVETNQTIPSV